MFARRKGGEIEIDRYEDDQKRMEIEIESIDAPVGSMVTAVIDGTPICDVTITRRTRVTFSTRRGETVPDVGNGSVAEIHYRGQVLLKGVFVPD